MYADSIGTIILINFKKLLSIKVRNFLSRFSIDRCLVRHYILIVVLVAAALNLDCRSNVGECDFGSEEYAVSARM